MVASITLLILSFVSIFVHADLWLVYRKQAHLFAPLFQLIPVKQRKTYQGAYRNSLKRQFYCVQDKVDVSGTTFTACFAMLYTYLFVSNLLSSENYISTLNFWLQGVFWYIYLLYCLGSYRDVRELCFYCKYEIAQGGLHCLLAFLFMTENFQWAFLVFTILVFSCVIFVRQAHKEDREEKRLQQQRKDQYKAAQKANPKKDDDAAESVEISTGRSSDDDGFDGAYLKPKTKAPPRAPPKASAPPKAAQKVREDSQLLDSIPEGKQQEEEVDEDDIEVIECPGIDGLRQRNNHMQNRIFQRR